MPAAIVVSVARVVVLSEAALTHASHEFYRASDQVPNGCAPGEALMRVVSNAGY